MSATVIDLQTRRTVSAEEAHEAASETHIENVADRIAKKHPELDWGLCLRLATVWTKGPESPRSRKAAPLTIAPDDPIFALFDA
jgi:hypothetical protein